MGSMRGERVGGLDVRPLMAHLGCSRRSDGVAHAAVRAEVGAGVEEGVDPFGVGVEVDGAVAEGRLAGAAGEERKRGEQTGLATR